MSRISLRAISKAILCQILVAPIVRLLVIFADPALYLSAILAGSGIVLGYFIARNPDPRSEAERAQNAGVAVLMLITWLFIFGSTSLVVSFVLEETTFIKSAIAASESGPDTDYLVKFGWAGFVFVSGGATVLLTARRLFRNKLRANQSGPPSSAEHVGAFYGAILAAVNIFSSLWALVSLVGSWYPFAGGGSVRISVACLILAINTLYLLPFFWREWRKHPREN